MKKIVTGLCCLMLVLPALALAQSKGPDNKITPPTEKEINDKKSAIKTQAGQCGIQARQRKLKEGSKEYHNFMGECLHAKK